MSLGSRRRRFVEQTNGRLAVVERNVFKAASAQGIVKEIMEGAVLGRGGGRRHEGMLLALVHGVSQHILNGFAQDMQVEKAMVSVDGLISDVMEFGSPSSNIMREPVSANALVEACVAELKQIYPHAQVCVEYDFQHSRMVSADVQRMHRVFSNIVGNAFEAMGFKGNLWFRTRDRNEMIEFCVGNSGSFIPPERLAKLFDAFVSSNKKGGTGLGLAIAKKIVVSHGGRIWCESRTPRNSDNGMVEFFFTLPADGQGLPL